MSQAILKQGRLGEGIAKLCTAKESVSTLLAADPAMAPSDAWQLLYGDNRVMTDAASDARSEQDDLHRAAACGNWGPTQPSELFLKIYRDVLATVEEDPRRAMVSPSLLGSHSVVPLTVISTIPDIARHMANVIARAEKEVFLATNYWQDSVASRYLTNALCELDRRAGVRGVRVVVKVMYDRGSPRQIVDPHLVVSAAEYTGKNVALPDAEALPNTDLEVMNYHQPLVGTFHSKYMIVDRKLALLQSNNIQDNDNLEMMCHFEGPIVDSFYDMALLSWSKAMSPPLPSYNSPATGGGIPTAAEAKTKRQAENGTGCTVLSKTGEAATANTTTKSTSHIDIANRRTNGTAAEATAAVKEAQSEPTITQKTAKTPNVPNGPDPATKAFLANGKAALSPSAIDHPTAKLEELPQSTSENPQYDVDIADEVVRVQTSVLSRPGETRVHAISRLLNHTVGHIEGDAPPCAKGEEMTPYLPLTARKPVPIAMVNRPPFGTPLHSSVVQPQNAAWLSALRNARKSVFVQTPTLNAEPLLPALREACERGIGVICYVCLGYNDSGELLPRQGGTNEMVAHKLYGSLSEEGRKHLQFYWYVAKDQTRPIPQVKKQRDCHIKLMIVDETVGIMGNGNQDTQSWYHSQEINVMLESREVCAAWIDGVRRNQNTHLYGALDKQTGIWRDFDGQEADGAIGVDPGRFGWAKGIVGAIKRVQGKGGF